MGSTRPITADDDFPDVLSLPQLDLESSDADEVSSDEEEDASDAGPGEEGEDVLDELAAEALLEQQLAEEADGSSVNDPVAPASGSMPRASALAKPGSLIHADDKARLLGFDARDYKDRRRIVSSAITGQPHSVWDSIEPGYGSESGEDEPENRVGSIPSHFYDDLPHIGYDVDGKRVMRPARGDALDKFLATVDADGEGWTSVYDKLAGKDVALTDEELDLIHRLARSENPDPEYDRAFVVHPQVLTSSLRRLDRRLCHVGESDGHAAERPAGAQAPVRALQVGAQEGTSGPPIRSHASRS